MTRFLTPLLFLLVTSVACSGDESSVEETPESANESEDPVASEDPDASEDPVTSLALSPELCNDAENMQLLLDSEAGQALFSSGNFNEDQVARMIAAPTDGPFYMFNLIRYREMAVYADGRETDLTGREADALYAPTEYLEAIGARAVFVGDVDEQIDGEDILWENVAVVEYPCPVAFFAMIADPEFQARAIHKDAGVEKTIIIVTDLAPIPSSGDSDQSEAAFPPTEDDPAFELVEVMGFRNVAQYEPDVDEPERSGRAAWELYQESSTLVSGALGHYTTASLRVQGVYSGDTRSWDEIQLVRMTSQAGYQAYLDDEARQASDYHRLAALEHNYSMTTYPNVSQFPSSEGSTPGGALPVTANGTGTVCQSDGDCPGEGVDLCLSDGSEGGFCTQEGCGAGECEAPYVCCSECSDAVTATLPFETSACLPSNIAAQLAAACNCESPAEPTD